MMTGSRAGSLKELDRLADRLRQQRQATPEAPLLVVEGPSDAVLLAKVLDSSVLIFPAAGRGNVLDAIEQLTKWGLGKFAGVVDRDFDDDQIDQLLAAMPRLRAYLGRDLEAMLILEGVAIDLMTSLGSAAKVASENVERIVTVCLEQATIIGRLRSANFANGWGLAFDKVNIDSKINKDSLLLNVQGYCAALAQTSPTPVSQADLIDVVNDGDNTAEDEKFSGKDALAFMGAALRKRLGTADASVCRTPHLAAVLRLAGAVALIEHEWTGDLSNLLLTA